MATNQVVTDSTNTDSQQVPMQRNSIFNVTLNKCLFSNNRSFKHLGSIYKITTSSPWLMLNIKVSNDYYGFYHYLYHLYQRRWCSEHRHNVSAQMDSIIIWKSTHYTVQCINLIVSKEIGNNYHLRLLVWKCTLFNVTMRCIHMRL